MSSNETYSFFDRLVHRIAFASPAVQITAADVEQIMYGRHFRHIDVRRPIFISSLPRAGTTLMLETLAGFRGLATHLYRDMPFVMAPLLWQGLSKSFRRPSQLIERAHGDGVQVGFDSPEAFEEVVWRAFWPRKFKRDRIDLWLENDDAGEFPGVLTSHMQRIVAVRSASAGESRRYLSKNNANIARLRFLKRLFPDSSILVPFRDPLAQAASLLHQHTRFLARHREDGFARKYMSDIGHLEFGQLHRPIAFAGIDRVRAAYRTETLDYWLAYWLHGFRHVLDHADQVVLISYERLCSAGVTALRALLDRLDISHEDAQVTTEKEFWTPRSYAQKQIDVEDKDLLESARAVYNRMIELSIV